MARYVALVEAGRSPVVETTESDARAASAEALFLGLRLLRRGVDLAEHRILYGADVRAEYADQLERFSEAGLIEFDGDVMKLPRSGALLSNEVFAAFV